MNEEWAEWEVYAKIAAKDVASDAGTEYAETVANEVAVETWEERVQNGMMDQRLCGNSE